MKKGKKNNEPFSVHGKQNPSFFQKEEELIAKLRQISHSTGSPQQIGKAVEDFIASFLRELLPVDFRVETRCKVIDHKGNYSREIDLAIVNAKFPRLFSATEGSSLLMLESVKVVFELKRSLDSNEISDVFVKANDWVSFDKRGTGKKSKCCGAPFITLCIESKIEEKTIRRQLIKESIKYNKKLNNILIYILRIKENEKRDPKKPPLGVFLWWEGLTDLSFNLTASPLSDCIYELHQMIYDNDMRELIQKYFNWGSILSGIWLHDPES
jgi:hypothetical protein